MTPKEKAEELLELFNFNCRECDNKKISALIAVNEILDYFKWEKSAMKFWQEVKQEIEKL